MYPWTRRCGMLLAILLGLPQTCFAQTATEPAFPSSNAVLEPSFPPPAPTSGISPSPSPGAFGDSSGPFGMAFGPSQPRVQYRFTAFPDEPVAGQPASLGFVRHDFLGTTPLWRDGPDELSFRANVRYEEFTTQAILPDSHVPFPKELWDVQLGLNYRHQFDNGWVGGAGVTFGSASDKPFHSINEMTAGLHTFLMVPSYGNDAWLFSLSYSSNSQLPIPIPGVAYLWQPSDNFRANIGLPFQLMWRPIDDLTLDLSYMLLYTVHARATYRLCEPVRAYVGFDWGTESYLRADREDDNNRLFYEDKRLTAGVQWRVCPNATLEVFGGYTFDRSYFESQHVSESSFNRIVVGDGGFGGARLEFRY
jgi:hypothetical protein